MKRMSFCEWRLSCSQRSTANSLRAMAPGRGCGRGARSGAGRAGGSPHPDAQTSRVEGAVREPRARAARDGPGRRPSAHQPGVRPHEHPRSLFLTPRGPSGPEPGPARCGPAPRRPRGSPSPSARSESPAHCEPRAPRPVFPGHPAAPGSASSGAPALRRPRGQEAGSALPRGRLRLPAWPLWAPSVRPAVPGRSLRPGAAARFTGSGSDVTGGAGRGGEGGWGAPASAHPARRSASAPCPGPLSCRLCAWTPRRPRPKPPREQPLARPCTSPRALGTRPKGSDWGAEGRSQGAQDDGSRAPGEGSGARVRSQALVLSSGPK